jgi:hypothetical protein
MPSYGMLRRVALVRTDVSEELSAFTKKQPYPSTESWDLALYPGHLQTHTTTCYPHSSLHPQSEFHTSFLSHLIFLRRVASVASYSQCCS